VLLVVLLAVHSKRGSKQSAGFGKYNHYVHDGKVSDHGCGDLQHRVGVDLGGFFLLFHHRGGIRGVDGGNVTLSVRCGVDMGSYCSRRRDTSSLAATPVGTSAQPAANTEDSMPT
jgi:hypothetical protein